MEFDFTNEIIEKILVKKTMSDRKYLSKMSEILSLKPSKKDNRIFEDRFFENKNLEVIEHLLIIFFDKYNRIPDITEIKALLLRYKEKHPSIDINKINQELMDLSVFDMDVNSESSTQNIESYIHKKLIYLAICDNSEDILKSGNVDRCIDRMEAIQKLTFNDTNLGLEYFSKAGMESHWDYIMNPEAKLKTGWVGLDNLTNGGFWKDGRCLICFMGQAGLGKSLFLSNITTNFLRAGLSVVVISLEMSENVYATRFDAHISETDVNRLRENKDTAMERINNFYKKYPTANLFIKEYPPRSVKVSDIEAYLDGLVSSGRKLDVIVVDYLNLVMPNVKSDNMYQGIQNVAERLRGLSYKYSAPIITATQTNRAGMNNENVGMENVSESTGITHTVDFMGALYQTPQDRAASTINMRILKNRFGGRVGNFIPFKLDNNTLTLKDCTYTGTQENLSEADTAINNIAPISADMENDMQDI